MPHCDIIAPSVPLSKGVEVRKQVTWEVNFFAAARLS